MSQRVSRRKLLTFTTSGVMTAAVGRLTFLYATSSRPARTIRWGVIGTGRRGAWVHIPALNESPEMRVVALCDFSPERLSSAISSLEPGARAYSDYQKLLADPEVDSVAIATPSVLHSEMVLASIAAGKHVVCETPAGVTFAEAREIRLAAQSAKTVVTFCVPRSDEARRQSIVQSVAAGSIGEVRYISLTRSGSQPNPGEPPASWQLSRETTGGTLNEFASQDFDLFHRITRSHPESICADGGTLFHRDERDSWDRSSVTLNYPNGVRAVHTFCLFGPNRSELRVIGDKGALIASSAQALRLLRFGARGATPKIEDVALAHSDAGTLLYEDFLKQVREGTKPDGNVDRAVAASRTCWLAELSSARKTEVAWDEVVA
ncbi:MAG TPA: Gfo/Idh/MocA family oxidoreductase [Tepidisphaeraceae bacterium]|jgi:predicted dehydrogenase|nr:Gfo/Idh/MocA family oxidoreductase [Tepidisphaeraceae bacterium]